LKSSKTLEAIIRWMMASNLVAFQAIIPLLPAKGQV